MWSGFVSYVHYPHGLEAILLILKKKKIHGMTFSVCGITLGLKKFRLQTISDSDVEITDTPCLLSVPQ